MNWKRELRKILYKYRSRIHGCVWDLSMPCQLTDPEKINFCIERSHLDTHDFPAI